MSGAGLPFRDYLRYANAVAEAAKTVHGMKWARVAEFEMEIDNKKITQYRATTKIYFDVEH